MNEVKGVGGRRRRRRRRKTHNGLGNIMCKLGAKGGNWRSKKKGNDSLSHEHKEEMQIIFHKFIALIISSIPNNNNP